MFEPADDVQRAVYEAMQSGDHIFARLEMHDVDVEGVDLAVEMPVSIMTANIRGALQGGLTATLVDIVAGRAAMAGLEAGHTTATNDMTIHYLAPIVDGPARAEGTVLRRGRRTVVVHVDVRDVATDRLAAVGTVSFTVLAPRGD